MLPLLPIVAGYGLYKAVTSKGKKDNKGLRISSPLATTEEVKGVMEELYSRNVFPYSSLSVEEKLQAQKREKIRTIAMWSLVGVVGVATIFVAAKPTTEGV